MASTVTAKIKICVICGTRRSQRLYWWFAKIDTKNIFILISYFSSCGDIIKKKKKRFILTMKNFFGLTATGSLFWYKKLVCIVALRYEF